MNCKRFSEVIFLFVDNEMQDDLLDSFQRHLEDCPGCKQKTLFTRRFLIVFRQRCARHSAPPSLRRRILTSLPHRNHDLDTSPRYD